MKLWHIALKAKHAITQRPVELIFKAEGDDAASAQQHVEDAFDLRGLTDKKWLPARVANSEVTVFLEQSRFTDMPGVIYRPPIARLARR